MHALPVDAPARRGGNLSSSCTQFPLETVIQLLKEAGVVLAADACASALGKPSEAAVPDADNLDHANMPGTSDYEGDETSWQQGLLPGEVGLQLSELEWSENDSDSSVASILGVCLLGFDRDAWMSGAEGAQDDMQVAAAAGDKTQVDIPWRTTAWSAGTKAVASAKVATSQGGVESGIAVTGAGESSVRVPLTADEKKGEKQLQDKARNNPSTKNWKIPNTKSADDCERSGQQLKSLSEL